MVKQPTTWTVYLKERRRQDEIMDGPVDPQEHVTALRALERINFFSGRSLVLWPLVRGLAATNGGRPLRLLDFATGGGDLPVKLWQRARHAGVALEAAGSDVSPQALAYARHQAQARGADVTFFAHDALTGPFPDGYDVLICSLFLHHLEDAAAVDVLRRAARAARRALVVYDLVRSRLGYGMARVGTRLLTRCPMVHFDGPASVQSAFTVAEARELAKQAGLEGATVRRCWPQRFLLEWRRP